MEDGFDDEVGAGDEGRVVVVAFERHDGEFVSVGVVRTTLVAGDCSSVFFVVVVVLSFSVSVVVERG